MIAQIAGASALIAAIAMPRISHPARQTTAPPPAPTAAAPPQAFAEPAPVAEKPVVRTSAPRPAHLNLDVKHAFRSVDLSVTVDGRSMLETTLEGGGKRFGAFGKRRERGYTKSLNLSPGVRVVRVRMKSEADKFDQTRVERFDLDSASVAGMKIAADKSGLSVVAERPEVVERHAVTASAQAANAPATPQPVGTPPPVAVAPHVVQAAQVAQAAQAAQEAGALAELYQTLRQVLIAVAGFIASAATGYVVQEFLRSRKSAIGL